MAVITQKICNKFCFSCEWIKSLVVQAKAIYSLGKRDQNYQLL